MCYRARGHGRHARFQSSPPASQGPSKGSAWRELDGTKSAFLFSECHPDLERPRFSRWRKEKNLRRYKGASPR
jgi:hypothetical protein